MNFRQKAFFVVSALASLMISPGAFASSRAELPVKTIQSSRPPYIARISGDTLISISLPPKLLALDMNAENSIASETGDFKSARYAFPNTVVPQEVVHNLARIYRYDRRRDVPIVSSGGDWVIAEYFKAGSHVPVARFRLLGRHVQRQEQLDRSGRTIKVIAIGWARQSAQDDDDSDASDLGDRPAWIRVFKVSPAGKRTLVALAWRRKRFVEAPSTTDQPDDNELAFGLPDGTVKWTTKAAFLKAQNIDLNAKMLGESAAPVAKQ
ncbi:hypothetical protein BWP39_23515 [Paraburkholderia acidicola]|uniref:Uncharacterized protein n=1 Tax=Paraburkholderia acidicola TaxID=1912599 RepID=A0A2A4END0_9BURK|nr:hypothetical protein [Paraburkholderia acidicola]PCE22651.1 hypothetical protein BWP39_23515 [Paraburkholderia acidicola]